MFDLNYQRKKRAFPKIFQKFSAKLRRVLYTNRFVLNFFAALGNGLEYRLNQSNGRFKPPEKKSSIPKNLPKVQRKIAQSTLYQSLRAVFFAALGNGLE